MIFVDTSFWVAFRNELDHHHAAAVGLWREHAGKGLCATNHVIGETWTFLRRKAGFSQARGFLDAVERSARITIDHVAPDLESEALIWLRRHPEREYSFVDATSFGWMRRRRVVEALAFDGDFSAAGFVELRS